MIYISIIALFISLLTFIFNLYNHFSNRARLSLDVFSELCVSNLSKSKFVIRICNYGKRPETIVGFELRHDGNGVRNINYYAKDVKTIRESEVNEFEYCVWNLNKLDSLFFLAASGKRWRLKDRQIKKINELISENKQMAKKLRFRPKQQVIDLSNAVVSITQIK